MKARKSAVWCLLIVVVVALAAICAFASPEQDPAGEVRVGARSLFVLKADIGSITASDRASIVNRRIDHILRTSSLDPREIAVEPLADGTPLIKLNEYRILEITPADATAEHSDADELADRWAGELRASLTQLQPLFLRQAKTPSVKTLKEHRVLLLILQVAVLLLAALACGEIANRLGQPPVMGQLLAGILLGHSVLGALWPELKAIVFPVETTQSYLLEVVSWIGVLFLLLLTGLETDMALIRQQGRPVAFISLTGVVFPFILGAGLGFALPESLLTTPASRTVFALFLGTVLSISSVPVVAKILLDMRLLRRNVGQLILAAALAHDTAGWMILGVVASLASSGTVELGVVIRTVLGTVLFLAFAATMGRAMVRRLLRWVNDRVRMEQALLSVVVILMLLSAAITQLIGVHAVLGAFVMGILLRESPVINLRVIHPLESVTTAVFAPIFFAAAGLHVNLLLLASPTLALMAVLLTGVACLGKIAGCYVGARWGGVSHWEALSVGFGTNARGAMGLIIGILGFSLGILTVDMFTLIVVMAVATTAMTPVLLRRSLKHVKPGNEEETRLRKEELQERSFVGRVKRVLLPSRGGEDASFAAALVNTLAAHHPVEVTGLYVAAKGPDSHSEAVHAAMRNRITAANASFHGITRPGPDPEAVIKSEAALGYDLIAVGAGPTARTPNAVFSELVDKLAREAKHPLLVVRAGDQNRGLPAHVLLPTSTAAHSVQAAELAVAIARATGAHITALHVYERMDDTLFWIADYEKRAEDAGKDLLEQVHSLAEAYDVPLETVLIRADQAGREIARVAREKEVDLIVMGGSARPTRDLFVGPTITTVLRGVDCTVAVLRP